MTPEELAAIRDRDAYLVTGHGGNLAHKDRRALLAHIDAITEALEGLEFQQMGLECMVDLRDVLAILRGTPQR